MPNVESAKWRHGICPPFYDVLKNVHENETQMHSGISDESVCQNPDPDSGFELIHFFLPGFARVMASLTSLQMAVKPPFPQGMRGGQFKF
jgi:hypothetical protein